MPKADEVRVRDAPMIRLIVLPPHRSWPKWADPPSSTEPDRERLFRLLARRGVRFRRIDPHDRPLNPFARAHSVLCAIDPVRALRVLLLHRKADVVLCYYESAALLILLLRGLVGFRAKIVVYNVGVAGGWRLRAAILRLVVPRADLLLPLATGQVPALLTMGAREEAVVPVRDATCVDFYREAPDAPHGYVLAIGDDVSRDYATFIEAVSGTDWKIVIRSRLIDERQALPANVTLIPRPLDALAYRDLLAGAAIVVLPLRRAEHPGGITTLLEAMASGKAVVVSASPGLADYALDGENCRVVAPGDADDLRSAIGNLLADAEERRRLGAAARRFVVANCSTDSDAAQFARLLGRLAGADLGADLG